MNNNYKYDFALFENSIGAINHYKDILIIAKMLKYAGYSVVILNYYKENIYCKNDEFPIIEINNKYKPHDVSWSMRPMSKFIRVFHIIKFIFQQYRYTKEFFKNINGIARNYYLGSYHLEMSSLLFTKSVPESNYFFWGLRSSHFTDYKANILKSPLLSYKAFILQKLFRSYKNFNLFISNELIRQEFINLGIEKNRLILREERIINNISEDNLDNLDEKFSLITLGYLREDKRIEFSIKAVKDLDVNFIIAGTSNFEYNKLINEKINGVPNITRIDKFLEGSEFNSLIQKAHFLLLCDKKQKSLVTNGTLMESLILNRPIIAPDYLPYSYYVNKYKIGLLFDPENIDSLKEQILNAQRLGVESFLPYLKKFQETLLIEKCVTDFNSDLKLVIE